jgi:hypothetical protein
MYSAEIRSLAAGVGFQKALGTVAVAHSIVVSYLVDSYRAIFAHNTIAAAVAEAYPHHRQQLISSDIEDTPHRTFSPSSLLWKLLELVFLLRCHFHSLPTTSQNITEHGGQYYDGGPSKFRNCE